MSKAVTGRFGVLYKQLQSEAGRFSNLNTREFFKRRINDYWQKNKDVKDEAQLDKLYQKGVQQLEMLKRQAIIDELYPGPKSMLEQKSVSK